jgi:hypothetical protein
VNRSPAKQKIPAKSGSKTLNISKALKHAGKRVSPPYSTQKTLLTKYRTTQLIILTGYPCSGLTHRAHQLAAGLEEAQSTLFETGAIPSTKPRYKINIVSTHDNVNYPRTVYDTARTEKEARGLAYTRAKRALGRDSFVILDGMNYIKGYRYQLWCEAKALGTTCCVVCFLVTPWFGLGLGHGQANECACRFMSGRRLTSVLRITRRGYGERNRSRNRTRRQTRARTLLFLTNPRPNNPRTHPPPMKPKATPILPTSSTTSSSATKNPPCTAAGTNPSSQSPTPTRPHQSPTSGRP